eukprot:6741309-Heterocapsa_arctica.AAC.1
MGDLTRGSVTLPDAAHSGSTLRRGTERAANILPAAPSRPLDNIGNFWIPPPMGAATSDDWETTR